MFNWPADTNPGSLAHVSSTHMAAMSWHLNLQGVIPSHVFTFSLAQINNKTYWQPWLLHDAGFLSKLCSIFYTIFGKEKWHWNLRRKWRGIVYSVKGVVCEFDACWTLLNCKSWMQALLPRPLAWSELNMCATLCMTLCVMLCVMYYKFSSPAKADPNPMGLQMLLTRPPTRSELQHAEGMLPW